MTAVAAANSPERPIVARIASITGDGASSLAHQRLCGGSGSPMGRHAATATLGLARS
jgi:hypothetical protein